MLMANPVGLLIQDDDGATIISAGEQIRGVLVALKGTAILCTLGLRLVHQVA